MTHSTISIDSNECNAANLFCISSIKEMSPVGLILNAQLRHVAGDELLFLLRFFDVVFNHELTPKCNLLTDKVTQHFWVASDNLNALCF
jgi:hypothetical protein